MTVLEWSSAGQRKYEAGVDRGVLYVGNSPGVIWPGLIAVNENPSGGEVSSYYLDGVKYLQSDSTVDFQGSIEALYSPVEFDVCEGIKTSNGMKVTHQPKVPFGLSYRTKIGNDKKGLDYGYKLHLVYNALVNTPGKSHSTISDTLDPGSLTWDFSTNPLAVPGFRPTAHYIFDSTQTPEELMLILTHRLYGTESSDPKLPSFLELFQYTSFAEDAGFADTTDYHRLFDGGGPTSEYPTVDAGSP